MIKCKVLSSLELLNLSKPRIKLLLKDLIDNLIRLAGTEHCESLSSFKNLCIQLKNKNIHDVSTFLSNNIVDYQIDIINNTNGTFANINFIFQSKFPIKNLEIKYLEL